MPNRPNRLSILFANKPAILETFARYSGLIAIFIYTLTCLLISILNFNSVHFTISYHIGLSPASIALFALADTFATVLLVFNLIYYARRRWQFHRLITAYALILGVCLLLVGWFPYAPQFFPPFVATIHRIGAFLFVGMSPVFILIFLSRERVINPHFHLPLIVFFVEAVLFIVIACFRADMIVDFSLITESLYLFSAIVVSQVLVFAPTKPNDSIDKNKRK